MKHQVCWFFSDSHCIVYSSRVGALSSKEYTELCVWNWKLYDVRSLRAGNDDRRLVTVQYREWLLKMSVTF